MPTRHDPNLAVKIAACHSFPCKEAPVHVIEYRDFKAPRNSAQYRKIVNAIENDDFKLADVKKLVPTAFYRAKLNERDRVLFKIFLCQGQRYALMLEFIENHEYDKSRFLRGAKIDEAKIPEFTLSSVKDAATVQTPFASSFISVEQSWPSRLTNMYFLNPNRLGATITSYSVSFFLLANFPNTGTMSPGFSFESGFSGLLSFSSTSSSVLYDLSAS